MFSLKACNILPLPASSKLLGPQRWLLVLMLSSSVEWNEKRPQFGALQEIADGSLLRFSGEWTQNQYGLDSGKWDMRRLNETEGAEFLAGDPETKARQDADWADIERMLGEIADPRLHEVCSEFVAQYSDRFRRSAAARKNHHARRGGLVEHVAQMMRAAEAMCSVYTSLNRDLLVAGVLFHDWVGRS